MPRWRLEHALFALWCVVLLVGAELLSRWLAPTVFHHPRWHGFAPDSVLGYGHRPNYRGRIFYTVTIDVRTNHLGLRDREYGPPRPDVRRVLMIGGSQTFGLVEEEQTFTRLLERELNRSGGRWEVINAGINGYGTEQELELMRRLLPVYRPDLVVLNVSANDFYDNQYRPLERWWVDGRGDLHSRTETEAGSLPPRPGLAGIRDRIGAYVNLFTLASNTAGRLVHRFRAEDRTQERGQVGEFVGRLLERRWDAVIARQSARTDSLLGQLATTARSASVRLLLVDEGARGAVSWAMWPAGTDTARYDLDRGTALLDQTASRLGVPCVHILPALRAARDPVSLYLPGDEHWGPRGHALAASVIAPMVRAVTDRASGPRPQPPGPGK